MAVSHQQKNQVNRLLKEGRKIEAVKFLRNEFRISLKKAKILADAIEAEMESSDFEKPKITPAFKRSNKAGKAVGFIFFGIGLIFLAIAFVAFINNQKQIESSDLVIGVVVSNPSSPTIKYEYQGETYYYYSSTSSSPPNYYLGEEVEVYVDSEFPQDAIVNTVTERWFIIILMGGMGTVFSLVSLAVIRLL